MSLSRALVCEFLGTAFLLSAVIGSGCLAHKLDMGNLALSVLCVAFSTGATLSALIFSFGSISAHFNPIVTLASALRGEFLWRHVLPYWVCQIFGAIFGVAIANLMFELPPFCISETIRGGSGQLLGEFVASFGLLGVIFGCARSNQASLPISVPFYVAGAIYFTSSTCFANPAVTIARMFTNSLCGISPASVLPFIALQLAGCAAALLLFGWLFKKSDESSLSSLVAAENSSTTDTVGADESNSRELVGSFRR